MTLTPEQKAEGWIPLQKGTPWPLSDKKTVFDVLLSDGGKISALSGDDWDFFNRAWVIAYRIIEAHGADAAPARPTPWPASYDELVWDADGWSQTIIVDGKRPEWLRDDDEGTTFGQTQRGWKGSRWADDLLAIRVRRREPKRETVKARLLFSNGSPFNDFRSATIELVDGEPDESTIKLGGKA